MAITIDQYTAKLLRRSDVLRRELEDMTENAKQLLKRNLLGAINGLWKVLDEAVDVENVVRDLAVRDHRATVDLDNLVLARLQKVDPTFPLTPPRDFHARLVIELPKADRGDGTVELELTIKLVTGLIDERLRQQIDREAAKIAQDLATALETSVEYRSTADFSAEPQAETDLHTEATTT